jgi:predicted nucleic acid-binding protein
MTVVVDTGGIIALVDADDRHHRAVRAIYESDPRAWVLPWAILPEVDYLLARHVGADAATAFRRDVAVGALRVEWGVDADLARAHALCTQYGALTLGLVDATVIAVAERLSARAIVTVDLRDFGAVSLPPDMLLLPRDAAWHGVKDRRG